MSERVPTDDEERVITGITTCLLLALMPFQSQPDWLVRDAVSLFAQAVERSGTRRKAGGSAGSGAVLKK